MKSRFVSDKFFSLFSLPRSMDNARFDRDKLSEKGMTTWTRLYILTLLILKSLSWPELIPIIHLNFFDLAAALCPRMKEFKHPKGTVQYNAVLSTVCPGSPIGSTY